MKILALFLALTTPAFASVTTTCELPQEWNGNVEITLEQKENRADQVTSRLVVNGEEIEALTPVCVYLDVPGRRGYRCTHLAGDVRIEVYPRFTLLNDPEFTGKVKRLHLILWEGNSLQTVDAESCR